MRIYTLIFISVLGLSLASCTAPLLLADTDATPILSAPIYPKTGGVQGVAGFNHNDLFHAKNPMVPAWLAQGQGYYALNRFLFAEAAVGGAYGSFSKDYRTGKAVGAFAAPGIGLYSQSGNVTLLASVGARYSYNSYTYASDNDYYGSSEYKLTAHTYSLYEKIGARIRFGQASAFSLLVGVQLGQQFALRGRYTQSDNLDDPAYGSRTLTTARTGTDLEPFIGTSIGLPGRLNVFAQGGVGKYVLSSNIDSDEIHRYHLVVGVTIPLERLGE